MRLTQEFRKDVVRMLVGLVKEQQEWDDGQDDGQEERRSQDRDEQCVEVFPHTVHTHHTHTVGASASGSCSLARRCLVAGDNSITWLGDAD